MFEINIKCPAKALLFGEFGLLSGGRGLVCTFFPPNFECEVIINTHDQESPLVHVQSAFFPSGFMEFVLDADFANRFPNEDNFFFGALYPWKEFLNHKKITIKVLKSFDRDLGFGSSSALIASMSYALYLFSYKQKPNIKDPVLWKKIRKSIEYIQTVGSGYDVCAQLACLIDQNLNENEISFWEFQNVEGNDVPIIKRVFESFFDYDLGTLVRTFVYSNTKQNLKKFSALYGKQYYSENHSKISAKFIDDPCYENLIQCMSDSLNLAKSQNILDDDKSEIKSIIENLDKFKIPYKTMGSGSGDCLWILAPKAKLIDMGLVNEKQIAFCFSDFTQPKKNVSKNTLKLELLPKKLLDLQLKLSELKNSGQLIIQNGDQGYASAPSNIALIKYWGKEKGVAQEPLNSSLSYTLSSFRSFTKITAVGCLFPNGVIPNFYPDHKLFLDNEKESLMPEKMKILINSMLSPFAHEIGLVIESFNNFPTACGIASSASGYAALVAAVADLLGLKNHFTDEDLFYWMSQWSRLGSGSATRSAMLLNQKNETSKNETLFCAWERLKKNANSEMFDNQRSITKTIEVHPNWRETGHMIFVLDEKKKKVSSSEGHKNVHTSPFQSIRTAYVSQNYEILLNAVKNYDFETVKTITESDALLMHTVMYTTNPPTPYLSSVCARVIQEFVLFRNSHALNGFWTLDAGPNPHFIFELKDSNKMKDFFNFVRNEIYPNVLMMENGSGYEGVMLGYLDYQEALNKFNSCTENREV